MNIPKGYKLVPVEPLKFALGLTCHGFKNRTDQEADKYAALKTITDLLESPTPPQPIYDEAKERKLFVAFAKARAMQYVTGRHPSLLDLHKDGDHEYRQSWVQIAWEGWLACAQSRAKAGEVDHE